MLQTGVKEIRLDQLDVVQSGTDDIFTSSINIRLI